MDDFSQIIGVILAIGFFLYSAFKKKNENKVKPLSTISDDLEMEGEISSDGYSAIINQEITQKKTCLKTHEPVGNKQEGVSQHMNKIKDNKVKPVDNDKSGKKFDLKQAIIHSEILNRKYF